MFERSANEVSATGSEQGGHNGQRKEVDTRGDGWERQVEVEADVGEDEEISVAAVSGHVEDRCLFGQIVECLDEAGAGRSLAVVDGRAAHF